MRKTFILFIAVFVSTYSSNAFSQATVGQQAPSIQGLQLLNKQLPDFQNKFIFIDFWATWCMPCRQSLPHINSLAEKYKDKAIFMAISDENETVVRKFLDKSSFSNLIFGLDIQKNLFSKLDIKAIPQYCLISPKNTILASGYSSAISDNYLDSIISHYNSDSANPTAIKITLDSVQKMSSIEIYETPGARKFLSQAGYTLLIRDSLKVTLPYLAGVKCANRIRWENIPPKMVEVKIFSRNIPYDSLKSAAHNQLMTTYGINMTKVTETKTVWYFNFKNTNLLKNKDTFIEDGVAQQNFLLNDSTYRLDNYTTDEMIQLLERVYFPRLFYNKNKITEKYDWDLHIVDPRTHNWISFEELKIVLSKELGIEIRETKKNETISIYSKTNK